MPNSTLVVRKKYNHFLTSTKLIEGFNWATLIKDKIELGWVDVLLNKDSEDKDADWRPVRLTVNYIQVYLEFRYIIWSIL